MITHTSSRRSLENNTPLLSPVDSEFPDRALPATAKKQKPWIFFCGLVFLLLAFVDVGAFLAEPPRTRVYEANICLHYYEANDPSKIGEDGAVPEKLCKVDEVQQKLAMIFGWQDTFDAIPSIILAVPFGALADKWGRKWIFAASLMGLEFNLAWVLLICYFKSLPLQLTWFSSAFYFIGGGPIVSSAIGITMLSDIVPPEKRTAIFLYITASILLAEMIAPIIASWLMERGDWTPLLLALALQQIGICVAFFFPETLHMRDLPEPSDDESVESQADDEDFSFKAQLKHFKTAFTFLKSDMTIVYVVLAFLANRLGRQAMTLLIRYASKRYSWEIKKAAYLLSFRAATNFVAITVAIPVVNIILVKYLHLPAHWADLWLARGSIVLTSASFFVLGAAAHPALLIFGLLVYNLGTGFGAAMRSVAIHVVGGQSSPDVGKLMSLIAITEALSVMVSGPLLNEMLKWGIEMGSVWLGLPFFGACIVSCFVTIMTFMLRVKGRDIEDVAYSQVRNEQEDELDIISGDTSALEHELTPRHTT